MTKRPIVNHPHYEDTGLRDRTHKLYTMFSRRPVETVHKTMVDMELDYFILEDSWCTRGRVSIFSALFLRQNNAFEPFFLGRLRAASRLRS